MIPREALTSDRPPHLDRRIVHAQDDVRVSDQNQDQCSSADGGSEHGTEEVQTPQPGPHPPLQNIGPNTPSSLASSENLVSSEPHIIVDKPPYEAGRPWQPLPLDPLDTTSYNIPPQIREKSDKLWDTFRNHRAARSYVQPTDRRVLADSNVLESADDVANVFDLGLLFDRTVKPDTVDPDVLHAYLLHIIGKTQSAADAWAAYSTLLTLNRPSYIPLDRPKIHYQYLHRLARLLSRNLPKTRSQFLRLLALLYNIQRSGGTIQLFEWNALIDNAGKGWRKSLPEDFKLALDVFGDMVSGRAPGASYSPDEYPPTEFPSQPPEADIYTYTTLINIAARTLSGKAVKHAAELLQTSGLPPNRITHLSLLKYFTATRQMSGVRSTLHKLRQQGLELGLDGANACMMAYSYNDHVDVVMKIYRVLRHNVSPEAYIGPDDAESAARQLEEECINIPKQMVPNEITYVQMVQIMAYHGNFSLTMNAFIDMLSTDNVEVGAPLVFHDNGDLHPAPYSPTMAIFRAIFLGFARHGVHPLEDGPMSSRLQSIRPWVLEHLQSLFDTFLELPKHTKPGVSIYYWIMVAFAKTSGNDVELMRRTYDRLEKRFGARGGPGNRLTILKSKLFSPGAKAYFDRHGFAVERAEYAKQERR